MRDGVTAEWQWCVSAKRGHDGYHWLPKSEYQPCEPPEEWRDVTKECAAWPWCAHGKTHDRVFYVSHEEDLVGEQAGYRLRKVQLYKQAPSLLEQWAFVVEEKVQP